MRQKGSGNGLFGLPVDQTRKLAIASFIIGLIFLFIMQPFSGTFSIQTSAALIFSREFGFLLAMVGVIVYVAYR